MPVPRALVDERDALVFPTALDARDLDARSITLVPTQSSGETAPTDTTSHTPGPTPTRHLKSDKEHDAPVGLIVGVALAILGAIVAAFLLRYLFVRRNNKRRAAALSSTLANVKQQPYVGGQAKLPLPAMGGGGANAPADLKSQPQASERDAVELGSYPPHTSSSPPNPNSNAYTLPPSLPPSNSWSTPFAGATTPNASSEPGPASSPAARQAYLAAELRAAQGLLERANSQSRMKSTEGGKIDVKKTKARIRELEERQQSAWAMGLE
ncbi:hypothetical protein C8R43DRAFT_1047343 [Mycena crocata]|nr:hypothetical protein C8R43DRAFT_1047343 [Mycena crocata]